MRCQFLPITFPGSLFLSPYVREKKRDPRRGMRDKLTWRLREKQSYHTPEALSAFFYRCSFRILRGHSDIINLNCVRGDVISRGMFSPLSKHTRGGDEMVVLFCEKIPQLAVSFLIICLAP